MELEKIYIGGWFQRTSLHLSEIYDFLSDAHSPLDLDQKQLLQFKRGLAIHSLDFKVEDFECISYRSRTGVNVKIFEDGLITLGTVPGKKIRADIQKLTSYYEEQLSPALSYLFSLGAPVPKELASIKTIYPYFLVYKNAPKSRITKLLADFDQKEHFAIEKEAFDIYRGDTLYVINNRTERLPSIEQFIQEQIFIREFKGQMHRYLNMHRSIWEKIAAVKERGSIKGKEIGEFRDKIESYQKTIDFIDARIAQMGTYVRTRESIFRSKKELEVFQDVLQFKYETLADTLEYVKDLWAMTKRYVESALELFRTLQAKSTENSVKNLTIVTTTGVGATLMGLFTQKPPSFTWASLVYLLILVFVGYAADRIMKKVGMNRMYKVKDVAVAKDI
jgi:hypothetical protein